MGLGNSAHVRFRHVTSSNCGRWELCVCSSRTKTHNIYKLRCYPQQLESFGVVAIETAYATKIKCCAVKNTSDTFGNSHCIFTRTLRNLTRYLHRNPPEPHQASSPPKPSGTSQSLCTGTFRNLTRYLPQNPPEPHHASSPVDPREPHQVAAPKPSIEPNQISAP